MIVRIVMSRKRVGARKIELGDIVYNSIGLRVKGMESFTEC